ncbi:hypothetical protein [Demetria terragena]|uniref:hypothetical protein n=1 Tax=Demetria terragena TaxID=63959 RepID=UPI00035EB300|nr:hypothetical protein [Demetria terragena]
MKTKKIGLATAGLLLSVGTLAGTATAYAETSHPAPSVSVPSASSAQAGADKERPARPELGSAVTGAEKAKVVAAVKKKDSAVTVKDVRQDSEGRYHVRATKGDERVMVQVSKDLTTVEVRDRPAGMHRPGGGHGGGPGGGGGDCGPAKGDSGSTDSPST